MPYNKYLQISEERYETLHKKYAEFIDSIYDDTRDPVKIFDPLAPQQLKELLLIREVSGELQKKRDDDLKKAAEAAAEAEAKAKEAAAQEAEVPAETTPEDTPVDATAVDATQVEA